MVRNIIIMLIMITDNMVNAQLVLTNNGSIVTYNNSVIVVDTTIYNYEITTDSLNYSRTIVNYSWGQSRTPFGYLSFTTNATILKIKANPTILTSYPYPANKFNQLTLCVNNNFTILYPVDTNYISVSLSVGTKSIRIIEGSVSKPSTTQIGTYIMAIQTNAPISVIHESIPSEKIVFIGNSITNSANTDSLAVNGYAISFREKAKQVVQIEGYGFGTLAGFTTNDATSNATASMLASELNGTDSNKLVISLGTNDFGLIAISSAIFQVRLDSLLRKVNRLKPTAHIFVISPILRTPASQETEKHAGWGDCDAYRTACENACLGKDYVTYIYGKTLVDATYMQGVHPNSEGHAQYYNNIKFAISP